MLVKFILKGNKEKQNEYNEWTKKNNALEKKVYNFSISIFEWYGTLPADAVFETRTNYDNSIYL